MYEEETCCCGEGRPKVLITAYRSRFRRLLRMLRKLLRLPSLPSLPSSRSYDVVYSCRDCMDEYTPAELVDRRDPQLEHVEWLDEDARDEWETHAA